MNNRRSATAARLRHDYKAHVRALQISEKRVFVYCEGRVHDPYMYSELTRRAQPSDETMFTIYLIEDIVGTGGKAAVLKLFRYMQKRKLLVTTYKGKPYCCLFFVDKDVDDLSRRRRSKSAHVFYTELYDLEAHIYRDTDLRRAVAIGLSVDVDMVPFAYGDPANWIEATAVQWEHWLILCLFSSRFNIDCGCSYGRVSCINPDLCGATDISAFETFKARLESKCGMRKDEFDRKFKGVQSTIEKLKMRRILSHVFRGKWLESIIVTELQAAFGGQKRAKISGAIISSVAMASFNFSSSWAGEHIRRVRNFIIEVL
jgi:hypothetical protein